MKKSRSNLFLSTDSEIKFSLSHDEVNWKEQFKKEFEAIAETRRRDARLSDFDQFENILKHQKNPQLWWKIATQSLPTLINWRCNYYGRAHENPIHPYIDCRDIFFAYLKIAVLERMEALTKEGRAVPKNLPNKVIEFLLNLSEMMTQEKLQSVPLASFEQNSSADWRTKFFGDPWNGKNGTGLTFLKLVRECAGDFIQNTDNNWKFLDSTFLGLINSIYVLELTVTINSYYRSIGKSYAEAQQASLIKFTTTLLTHPEGPLCLYDRSWRTEDQPNKSQP